MLNQFIKPGIILFGITLPVWLIFRITIRNLRRRPLQSFQKEMMLFLFFIYVTGVLLLTVIPIPMSLRGDPAYSKVNLVPMVKTVNGVIDALDPAKSYLVQHYL